MLAKKSDIIEPFTQSSTALVFCLLHPSLRHCDWYVYLKLTAGLIFQWNEQVELLGIHMANCQVNFTFCAHSINITFYICLISFHVFQDVTMTMWWHLDKP
jgi:hypothetical protein